VKSALQRGLNTSVLFASLWASYHPDVTFPLSGEAVDWAVNSDLTGEKMRAWQWIDEGLPFN
jgi:hypothetical protein